MAVIQIVVRFSRMAPGGSLTDIFAMCEQPGVL